jgi:S-DNA-T family DNA segregation ATPase FtsK/SpoIIIE
VGRKRKNPKHKQTKPRWFQKEDNWGNFVFDWSMGLSPETWREIFAVLILIFSFVALLGLFGLAGSAGAAFSRIIAKLFGNFGAYLFIAVFFYSGVILLIPPKKYKVAKFVGMLLFVLFLPAFTHLFIAAEDAKTAALGGHGGGLVGYLISNPLRSSLGLFPAFLISFALVGISILMMFNFSLTEFLGISKQKDGDDDEVNVHGEGDYPERVSVFEAIRRKVSRFKNRKEGEGSRVEVIETEREAVPARKDRTWEYPPLDILKDTKEVASSGNIHKNAEIIKNCLKNFGIDITMNDVNIGPTVTQYAFKPDERVKLNQVIARQTDLALALSAKSLRMEAPIPGKNLVGIEIPNTIPAKVSLKDVLQSSAFRAAKSKLAIALGRDVSGARCVIDLEKMPHLLIAGSTGSGKSVCINSIICAFLFNNSPNDLRLLLVDPKRVELTNYNGIPHLLSPVVTEVDKTVSALKWAVAEMERRYKMFSEQGKRNIIAYNSDPGPEGKLPYIVVIIDELADLMATSSKEVEGSIVRIAQLARATGMHLIVATQRPSVDVLTGLIKANISSRIAFATASQVDSRTILDLSGAEKLLGNGDMLFIGNGLNKPKRIQGCFVSDEEIEQLTSFLKSKGEALYDESILSYRPTGSGMVGGTGGGNSDDDLYEEALDTVVRAGKASASLLQRRLRIGYARAARLLDILEGEGAIGPADGAKPRDVLVGASDSSYAGRNNDNLENIDNQNNYRGY